PSEPAYPCCLPALGRFTGWTPCEGSATSLWHPADGFGPYALLHGRGSRGHADTYLPHRRAVGMGDRTRRRPPGRGVDPLPYAGRGGLHPRLPGRGTGTQGPTRLLR